ncbi:probable flavin-containing monooxygenase 1 [Tanacetum coccineum]
MENKKQVAIIGAGVSGLLACKYCLSKGFKPMVFDFESDIGGVWSKSMKTTRLQVPHGKGPEVFQGKVIHSMEYATMDHDKAAEFVKGKKVVVVGFGKTGLDIARECSSLNDWAPWGIPMTKFYFTRFSELLVHKPGEDSENFFDELEKGSIKLKKSKNYSFYDQGILIDEDNTKIEADVVIFATGFKGEEKLKSIFESSTFGQFITDSPRVPLYRECIHPRIPLLAVIGFSESLSNIYISEMRAKWVASLLEGAFKVPNVDEMQKDIAAWDEYMKQSVGEYHYRSSVGSLERFCGKIKDSSLGSCLLQLVPHKVRRVDGAILLSIVDEAVINNDDMASAFICSITILIDLNHIN